MGILGAVLLLVGAPRLNAQTPAYQWNFDGVTGTGVPSITGGGGTLSTVIGSGNFGGAGLTGAGTDWTYRGATASDGVRSTTDISKLGTDNTITITFWINASIAYGNGSLGTQFGRLLMLGNSTAYDESVGNASPGFSLALNGTGLQYNINNGAEPTQANVFAPYGAGQWVFVALEYDGTSSTTSSSALGGALGNSSANLALLLGTTSSSIGSPTMLPLAVSGTLSPGPITNTATMALMVGNRASGGRGFQGQIENINIFTNQLLTGSQLESLRISSFATSLTAGTIASANPAFQGTTLLLFTGVGGGTGPYTYQWQTDGGGGGSLTNIPGATFATFTNNTTGSALGNFQYQVIVTDSTTASVTTTPLTVTIIKQLSGTLTDLGTNAPVAGGSDAAQLTSAFTFQSNGGLNYFDNATPAMGQTFTTGANAKGYSMNSLAIQLAGGSSGAPAVAANLTSAGMTNQAYDLRIYSVSGGTATYIADITNLLFSFANTHWIQWTFPPIVLTNNATYAYTFQLRNTANYCGLSTSDGTSDHYTGGQMVGIPNGGGSVTFSSSVNNDATFDVGLIPNGVPFLLSLPAASPNPVYALSPVKMSDIPSTPGIYTYKWITDDGLGGFVNVSGATTTNLTVVPQDLNPGGADYTTNYYFVATDTTSGNSVTSSVIALTVHAASAPLLTGPTPASLVTFVGQTLTYTANEVGTTPITNQWQFNNGGGFVSLTSQTNVSLTLPNLQTTSSGTYQLAATNRVGNASSAVTLTVLPAPAAPIPASQQYFNKVSTNSPWAYWRLNETNDPTAVGAPVYTAYDYSGHGFFATYGNAVTVSNAGPQTPAFPGFDAGELAAGTTISTANAYLTPPALNLAGKSSITFIAWINPNGGQAAAAGLLFNRGGPDVAAGFGFGNTSDHLGYTWNNNNATTYNWDSTLVVADNEWNFVAYVITPTNATIYLGNLNGGTTNFFQANNAIAHTTESFAGGTVRLGGDPLNTGRSFNGLIDEATLFTNALTSAQIQQYFLTGIGGSALAPTLPATQVAPSAALSAGVYSGQNVRMTVAASGTEPLSYQWQSSPDNSTWANVPGATSGTLVINPFTVGTTYYQLVVTNVAAAVTNTSVAVTYNPLPVYPAGLWTVNFEPTNNIGAGQNVGGGVGHYVGRGILGNGTYWNIMPHILTVGAGFAAGTITNVTDFKDDGVTSSGISCRLNSGGSYNSLGSSLTYSADVANLLDQFYRTYFSPNALQFSGLPDGTYNLTCYAGNGVASSGANNFGSMFVLHAANGLLTNSTAEPTPVTDALSEGVNFVTFTNVHITGGALNADIYGNTAADPNASATIEGAQIQLIAYDPPGPAFSGTPTNVFVSQTVVFTNTSTGSITNAVLSYGDGISVTNSSFTTASHSYAAAGTYTVTLKETGPGGTATTTRTSYITVSPFPAFASVQLSAGSLILSGTNGPAGTQYRILATTNLTLPIANWTTVYTSTFAPDGSYGYTNSSPTNAASFYRLVSP